MRLSPRLILLAGTLVLLHARVVRAECEAQLGPEEEFRRARAVFYGRVTKVVPTCAPERFRDSPRTPREWSGCYQAVHFQVLESWKGVASNEYRVLAYEEGDGSLSLAPGERWLVFALPPSSAPGEEAVLPPGSPPALATSCQTDTARREGRNALTRAHRKALRALAKSANAAPKARP